MRTFVRTQPDFTDKRYHALPEARKVLIVEMLINYYAFRLAAAPSEDRFERDRLATLRERLRLPAGNRSDSSSSDAPPHQAQPPGLFLSLIHI